MAAVLAAKRCWRMLPGHGSKCGGHCCWSLIKMIKKQFMLKMTNKV